MDKDLAVKLLSEYFDKNFKFALKLGILTEEEYEELREFFVLKQLTKGLDSLTQLPQ